MTIPAVLYDASESPRVEIATIRMSTNRRAAYSAVNHKLDQGWVDRVEGGGAVEMRVRAEGLISLDWLANLYTRQDARSSASYQVEMNDGDSHAGSFVVEELEELADNDDGRRRFRLVLLSAGRVVYTSAP